MFHFHFMLKISNISPLVALHVLEITRFLPIVVMISDDVVVGLERSATAPGQPPHHQKSLLLHHFLLLCCLHNTSRPFDD